MAPAGSKGDVVPVSTTKPMFLLVLFHVTVVPAVTQKSLLLLAFGMLGVEEAPLEVRLTSTSQGLKRTRRYWSHRKVAPDLVQCMRTCWLSWTARLRSRLPERPLTVPKGTRLKMIDY